jgi:hypothetical protein
MKKAGEPGGGATLNDSPNLEVLQLREIFKGLLQLFEIDGAAW